jgi:hypothetical protein
MASAADTALLNIEQHNQILTAEPCCWKNIESQTEENRFKRKE